MTQVIYFAATIGAMLLLLFSVLFYSFKNGISPMPTSSVVRKTLMKNLPELKKGSVMDLGSGWGNLIFPLSEKYPKRQVLGYENSPLPFLFSFLLQNRSNLTISPRSFLGQNLEEASLIVCYLYPKLMKKLKKKLEKELKTGTWVISHTFAVPGWKPKKTIEADDLYRTKIYFYRI